MTWDTVQLEPYSFNKFEFKLGIIIFMKYLHILGKKDMGYID